MSCDTILSENKTYWTHRAPSYSAENQEELGDAHREAWKAVLSERILSHFSGRTPEDIHILEIGTGPGFFAIILAEAGFSVTAVDLTPTMLAEAKKNAGSLAEKIDFQEMNAESLTFDDYSFDAVVTRNLTWNLPHPETAYAQWRRVLKEGGILLNFDANWYNYLFYEEDRFGYNRDRENTAAQGYKDQNIGENYNIMEEIARRIPLSSVRRPDWDMQFLARMGMRVVINRNIWQRVWSEAEQSSFASTPMFMVQAVR